MKYWEPISIKGIRVDTRLGKVRLLVELDDGWHLCANDPMDDKLFRVVNPGDILSAPLRYTPEGDRAGETK